MKKNILFKYGVAFLLLIGSLQSFAAGLSFTANTISGCAPLAVTFTNTSSDVTAYRYEWNFNDGSPILIDTMPTTVNHTFVNPGSYGVFINVYTSTGTYIGFTYCLSGNINASGISIQASDSTCIGDVMTFCANGNSVMSPSWNFGDPSSGANNTSTQYCPTHAFASNGTYTITLTANSSCGTTTVTKTVIVGANVYPHPSVMYNINTVCPGQSVQLNTDGYTSYSWNFGDPGSGAANTSTIQNPIHAFSTVGNFTPTVIVTNGCGHTGTANTPINVLTNPPFPTAPFFHLQGNTPICPSSMVNFDAPNGYSSYEWNYGDGTLDTTTDAHTYHTYGATLTTYPASVRVISSCGNDTLLTLSVVVSNSAPFPNYPGFSLSGGPNPLCLGDAATVNAPQGYANYNWDFGDGQTITSGSYHTTHIYAANGTYNVSCTITNNCGNDTILSGPLVVNGTGSFPSGLHIEASPTTSCPNDIIEFKVNQSGFASYAWDFGDGATATSAGERIQHAYTAIGTYNVTCVVTNGCGLTTTLSGSISVTGSSPVNPNLAVSAVQNPTCPNDEVFFFVDHGQPNYTYTWNYGDASALDTTVGAGSSHQYAAAGTYNVTLTAINGCGLTLVVSTSVVVSGSAVPTLHRTDGGRLWGFPGGEHDGGGSPTVSTAGCVGDAIAFYFEGAAASNVYDFGDGTTATAVDQLLVYTSEGTFPVTMIRHEFPANGNYLITLTITNGCGNSVTDTMTIHIGGNLPADGEMTTSPPPFITCAPIQFLAFGGESYEWDFGDGGTLSTTSSSVSHTFASAGVYVVSVVVTNGCGNSATVSRSLNVTGMGGPAITLTSSLPPTCVSGSNGAATVSVTSGLAPYTYAWNDASGQTSPTATGLPAGLYYATVTDQNGCASTLAVNVNNPAPIATSVSTTTTACGAATGTATVSVTSGGTGPFTYLWSTGITTAAASGMATGPYTVTITDANSCSTTATATVSENGGATVSLNTATNTTCNGGTNGAININVTGGATPYTYLWSNGSTVQDPSGLAAGNYSVTVTDNSGCHATLNVNVGQPSAIVVQTAVVVSPTCGNFDGSATASATGGTGPYTYHWDAGTGGSGQVTATATGIPAGTYTVTVTDAAGCTMDGVIDLSNSNAPNISSVVTNVSCFGGSNGAIDITVTGGTSPYLYTWTIAPPQTNHQDVNTLLPGNYSVFVNDAHGCMSFRTYTVTQPNLLTVAVTNTGVTCGNIDGTATATPSGGNTTFNYAWTGGQTTQTATGLTTGNFTVTVTDNRGCIATGTTTLAAATLVQEICMVTVDTASTHNIIVWEKSSVTNIDSFKVYREDVTNVYTLIGTVSYDSLSEFHDFGADPNVTTKRYKITEKDNCGGESVKSNYHNTIYIVDNGAGQFTWNPIYTVENGANPVNNYRLMRDDNNTGVWNQVGITAGTQNTLADPAYMSYPNGRWYVETVWGITCTPTRATVNTSRSNIKHAAFTVGVQTVDVLSSVNLYPNPAKEEVTVELPVLNENVNVRIMNAIGQVVYEQNIVPVSNEKTLKRINTESFAKGIYTISIETRSERMIKKLVIN